MATLLYRLGRTAYRRWPFFIAAWLVALVVVGVVAGTASKPLTSTFSIPGIPSERAAELQSELFPDAPDPLDEATVNVVVAAPEGSTLSEPTYAREVRDLVADLRGLPQLSRSGAEAIVDPVSAARAQEQQIVGAAREAGTPLDAARANAAAVSPLSADGRVGTISFAYDVDSPADVEPATQDELERVLADHRVDGMQVEANGTGTTAFTEFGVVSELIGIGVALLVLVLTFGSLVAAGLPIVSALVGVGLGAVGVLAATAVTDLNDTTPILATMIGLAVGIDYALFILARYRSELEHTDDRAEAVGTAVGTAGSAVVFAGLTVVIALAALTVVGIPFLTSMGLAAAGTVAVAVLVALTLLPAVLGLMGRRAFGGQVRRYAPKRDAEGRVVNNGTRWARLVGRAPVAAVLLVVVALGALAVPVKDLHLALPSDSTSPSDTTQRKAADLVADAFGPGRQSPLLVVVDARAAAEAAGGGQQGAAAAQEAFGAVTAWAARQDDVVNAQVTGVNEAGTGAQVLVTPASSADDTATDTLLTDLRDGQAGVEEQTGTTLGVTGQTAIQTDISDKLSDALPVYLAIVIGLAFLLLMVVFRSVLVPLTATLGFLLSVLGTLGATVLIFQEGTFGLSEPQPIVSFMPIFLVGVVFGLAMDYQVFLVTRIREAHVHGASPREAVVDGFRSSARVVTAAAVIMISVFAAFMLQDLALIKSIGFALAVAVFLDAFVVRMTLIPALMYLLGDRAWWLPRWLDRLLPDVDVEGERLLEHRGGHREGGAHAAVPKHAAGREPEPAGR